MLGVLPVYKDSYMEIFFPSNVTFLFSHDNSSGLFDTWGVGQDGYLIRTKGPFASLEGMFLLIRHGQNEVEAETSDFAWIEV